MQGRKCHALLAKIYAAYKRTFGERLQRRRLSFIHTKNESYIAFGYAVQSSVYSCVRKERILRRGCFESHCTIGEYFISLSLSLARRPGCGSRLPPRHASTHMHTHPAARAHCQSFFLISFYFSPARAYCAILI